MDSSRGPPGGRVRVGVGGGFGGGCVGGFLVWLSVGGDEGLVVVLVVSEVLEVSEVFVGGAGWCEGGS